MSVKEGQILARLDDANVRHALALAEARVAAAESALNEIRVRLREAELDLGRARNLASEGVASRQFLDAAQAARDSFAARLAAARDEVKVAEREVSLRRQDVEDTLIRAPFDGVATSRNAQPGEIVSPVSAGGGFTRTGIGTIVDMGSLEIEVDVNEAFIQRVRRRSAGGGHPAGLPRVEDPRHVITTVPAADRQKATVKVRIAFNELGDPRILPDMGVKVPFQAEPGTDVAARPRLLVPERALRREKTAASYSCARRSGRAPGGRNRQQQRRWRRGGLRPPRRGHRRARPADRSRRREPGPAAVAHEEVPFRGDAALRRHHMPERQVDPWADRRAVFGTACCQRATAAPSKISNDPGSRSIAATVGPLRSRIWNVRTAPKLRDAIAG